MEEIFRLHGNSSNLCLFLKVITLFYYGLKWLQLCVSHDNHGKVLDLNKKKFAQCVSQLPIVTVMAFKQIDNKWCHRILKGGGGSRLGGGEVAVKLLRDQLHVSCTFVLCL